VLLAGGWAWGQAADPELLAVASGTAFSSVVLGQLAAAYACRGETLWVGQLVRRRNPLLRLATFAQVVLLFIFLAVPALASTLGGSMPSQLGWILATGAIPMVIAADTADKALRHRRTRRREAAGMLRTAAQSHR
jgi:hypothetical protein